MEIRSHCFSFVCLWLRTVWFHANLNLKGAEEFEKCRFRLINFVQNERKERKGLFVLQVLVGEAEKEASKQGPRLSGV